MKMERFQYPLEVVDLNDYFMNKDMNLACFYSTNLDSNSLESGFDNAHIKEGNYQYSSNRMTTKILFTGSDTLKRKFENAFSSGKNDLICLDNHVNFKTIEEVKSFLDLLNNTKSWLLHGQIMHEAQEAKNCCQARKNTQLYKKGTYRHQSDALTDVLLILDVEDNYIREELTNGIHRLMISFYMDLKAVFEINFEDALKVFTSHAFRNNSRIIKNNKLELSPKLILSNLTMSSAAINDSFSNVTSKPKHLGTFITKIKHVLSTKKFSRNYSSSTYNSKFSLDKLPYLFCSMNSSNSKFIYTSYNDQNFNALKNNHILHSNMPRKHQSNYDIINNASDLIELNDSINASFESSSSSSLFNSRNSSNLTKSPSDNSQTPDEFQCTQILDDNSNSNAKAQEKLAIPRSSSYHNEKSSQSAIGNTMPRSVSSMSTGHTENIMSKAKSFYVKNVQKRTSKCGSSLSLANLKRKKSSNSLDKNCLMIDKNLRESTNPENACLLDHSNTSDYESGCSDSNLNEAFFNDLENSSVENLAINKKEEIRINTVAESKDELIRIHPSLVVKRNLESNSMGIMRTSTIKPILKENSVYQLDKRHSNFNSIDHTTKLNTYLNSHLVLNHTNSQERLYEQLNSTNYSQSSYLNAPSNLKPASSEFLEMIPPTAGLAKFTKNTNQSVFRSNVYNKLNSGGSKSSLLKTKCSNRIQAKTRRPVSPPPPIFISDHGLLAPPPPVSY